MTLPRRSSDVRTRRTLTTILLGCGVLLVVSLVLNLSVAGRDHRLEEQREFEMLLPVHQPPRKRSATGTVSQKKKKKSNPHLIIHAGPGKTGTSTIQHELGSKALRKALAQDGYIYAGKEGNPRFHHLQVHLFKCTPHLEVAFNATGTYDNVRCWQHFRNILKKHYDRGQSVIMSGEEFTFGRMPVRYHSQAFWDTFRTALEDWDVHVVLVYRRYGEWLLSAKRQGDGEFCLRRFQVSGSEWPVLRKEGIRGGNKCNPTWRTVKHYIKSGVAFQYLFPNVAIKLFEHLQWPITLLNFHDEGHITTNLLCNAIQDAPTACEYSRRYLADRAKVVNARSSHETMYDDIVVDAAKNGLIDLNRTRVEVYEELEQRVQVSLADVPVTACPSLSELEWLLNRTLVLEKKLMPELYASPQGKETATAEFWRLANGNAYCSVDTDRLMKNMSSWEELVNSLAASSKS